MTSERDKTIEDLKILNANLVHELYKLKAEVGAELDKKVAAAMKKHKEHCALAEKEATAALQTLIAVMPEFVEEFQKRLKQ